MEKQLEKLCALAESAGFFQRLEELYRQMDDSYLVAADHYGFACTGCTENCCLTRFHHHTHVEFLYLVSGFLTMNPEKQSLIQNRAVDYEGEMKASESEGSDFSRMCPLNEEGLCLLYDRRPMICRLHGLPHELNPPGRGRLLSSGCGEFDSRCGGQPYFRFDRTPFYLGLSDLEQQFKRSAGLSEKFKQTIAQMIISTEE